MNKEVEKEIKQVFSLKSAKNVAKVKRVGDLNDRYETGEEIRSQRRFVSSESLNTVYR